VVWVVESWLTTSSSRRKMSTSSIGRITWMASTPGTLGSEAGRVLSIPTGRCGHSLERPAPGWFRRLRRLRPSAFHQQTTDIVSRDTLSDLAIAIHTIRRRRALIGCPPIRIQVCSRPGSCASIGVAEFDFSVLGEGSGELAIQSLRSRLRL
jgi:hypothetical protein